MWNFGNVLPGVTKRTFGKDAQYGVPDVARFGGTNTSPVMTNPATTGQLREGQHLNRRRPAPGQVP